MALGFKKSILPKSEDVALMGGMGLSLLTGGIAPAILAAMYKENRSGAREEEERAQREAEIKQFAVGETPAAPGVYPDFVARPASEAEQRRKAAELFPVDAATARVKALNPDPETFGDLQQGIGPDGQPMFFRMGSRGSIKSPQGVSPLPKETSVEMVNVFDRKRNIPIGAVNKRALDRLSQQEPGRYQIMGNDVDGMGQGGMAQRFNRETGGQVQPGTMPMRGPDGQWSLAPIPGSDKDPAMIEAERMKKLQAEAPGAKAALNTTTQFYDTVLAKIDQIEQDPNTADVVGAWEGSGEPWGLNPLTAQGNATAFTNIENLQDMLQVQGLQMMRDASKTGGAVGSVTEREWPKLSSRFGNLNRRQGETQFLNSLKDIRSAIQQAKQSAEGAYFDTYEPGARGAQSPQPGAAAPAPSQADIPPPQQRRPNAIYQTPKGPMRWTGTGWIPANEPEA